MRYQKDKLIDPSALDVEWLGQAALAIKYGKNWAECTKRVTEAEEQVKITRAELIKEANEEPDTCLGEGVKPTGPNVEAYYRTHADHIAAKNEWIEAQYELNMASVAKSEIGYTRKLALENLVKLHGQNYFAGPSVPRDLILEWDSAQAIQQESNKKIKVKRLTYRKAR